MPSREEEKPHRGLPGGSADDGESVLSGNDSEASPRSIIQAHKDFIKVHFVGFPAEVGFEIVL